MGKSWFVYMVECSDESLYTGITNNVERRIQEHNSPEGGSHYTQSYKPVKLLWKEEYTDRYSALEREKQIKGWTRKKKIALIQGDFVLLKKL